MLDSQEDTRQARAFTLEHAWEGARRGPGRSSPRSRVNLLLGAGVSSGFGCLQSRLLDSLVPEVFAQRIQISHPSSNHMATAVAYLMEKSRGDGTHFPHFFCYERKAKYFPAT